MPKLSAFADEAYHDFHKQLEFLNKHNIAYIEMRLVNKKNTMDLNNNELKEARQMLRDNGVKVCALGSPIGKIGIDEPFEPHLAVSDVFSGFTGPELFSQVVANVRELAAEVSLELE